MSVAAPSVRPMLIDCGSCTVRGDACTDCVVTFLTIPVRPSGAEDAVVELDAQERRALDVLADSGLVPRLRLTS